MGGRQKVIGPVPVLEAEEVLAVLLPAMGGLVRLSRQEGREVDLLCPDSIDLLTDNILDLFEHL